MPIKFTDLDPTPSDRLLQTCKQLRLVLFSLKLGSREFFSLGVLKSTSHSKAESREKTQAQKTALCTKSRGWAISWATQILCSPRSKSIVLHHSLIDKLFFSSPN